VQKEFADGLFGVGAYFERIGADKRTGKHSAGQARYVVPLERFKRTYGQFRGVRDLPQRDASRLSNVTHPRAEVARRHVVDNHLARPC
jgi:hypothetical protein